MYRLFLCNDKQIFIWHLSIKIDILLLYYV